MNNSIPFLKKVYFYQLLSLPIIATLYYTVVEAGYDYVMYELQPSKFYLIYVLYFFAAIFVTAIIAEKKTIKAALPNVVSQLAFMIIIPSLIVLLQVILTDATVTAVFMELALMHLGSVTVASVVFDVYAYGPGSAKRLPGRTYFIKRKAQGVQYTYQVIVILALIALPISLLFSHRLFQAWIAEQFSALTWHNVVIAASFSATVISYSIILFKQYRKQALEIAKKDLSTSSS